VQFDIDTAGHLTDVHLLRSTGDLKRDAKIEATFARVALDEPPPADMAQPVYMIVQPAPRGGRACRPAASDVPASEAR
jgi:hypothetical protein